MLPRAEFIQHNRAAISLWRKALAPLIGATLAVALLITPSLAGSVLIQYTGLDIDYDGAAIFTSSSPDTLTSVSITDDGVPVTGSPFGTDIDIDLLIPGVTGIPIGGGTVSTVGSGLLDLGLPGADGISLILDPASITYINVGSFVRFAFAATVANISGQMLPDGLVLGSPVSVSFSTQVKSGTLATFGGFVTAFEAGGTGEIEGTTIPEPATCLLGMFGILSLGLLRSRQR